MKKGDVLMKYLTNRVALEFLQKTKKQKLMIIDNVIRRGFKQKDSTETLEYFSTFSFENMQMSKETYKKYLRSIQLLLIEENDHVAYFDGIKVLRKCNKEIHQRICYKTLIDAFAKRVYEVEGKYEGFAMWMQDAKQEGVITQTQCNRLLKEYKNEEVNVK